MEEKKDIEMNIADTVIEKPICFKIGSRRFFLYPPTIGKTYLLVRLIKSLEVNEKIMTYNPYMEALRLCDEKKSTVCRILAYHSLLKKRDIVDEVKVKSRQLLFEKSLDDKELATMLVLVLSNEDTNSYIQYLGIDKDREKRQRISSVKKQSGSITFGGKSIYGTMIDFACQRYGWTMEYVVWGISYANLKMLMADALTSVYLSEEERKNAGITDDEDVIDAESPENIEMMRKIISE